MKLLRRWLILTHRYLGIPLSALFVVWFASGIVMMYVGEMPGLTPELRLQRLADLDLSEVRLTPGDAASRSGVVWGGVRATLVMVLGRPAYRLDDATVFADTGTVLEEVGPARARDVVRQFTGVPEETIRYVTTLMQPDQWTLANRRGFPLHKFRLDDDLGSELYVSSRSADVTVLTTRRSRALAWLGAIPHWLYFATLRLDQSLWSSVVVWASTLGCIVVVVGLLLGIVQFRWRQSREELRSGSGLSALVPYAGWMWWHCVTGVVVGLFTLTWVFSGLLSMEPYAWTNARGLELPRDTLTGGPLDLSKFPAIDSPAWSRLTAGHAIKELDFVRIQGDPYYVVRMAPDVVDSGRLLVAADTLTVRPAFSVASLIERLRAAASGVPILESELLTEYDAYYYSRDDQNPLPVLRVKFADPANTWFYVDPEMGRVLGSVHRLSRVERWLFNGLHSLDFSFWYSRRPLWDIGMIGLSLGGLASSVIGLWVGLGRVRRAFGRMAFRKSPRRS